MKTEGTVVDVSKLGRSIESFRDFFGHTFTALGLPPKPDDDPWWRQAHARFWAEVDSRQALP